MRRNSSEAKGVGNGPRRSTLAEIQKLERDREERRRNMQQIKADRAAEEKRNLEEGKPGDVDFQRMVRNWRETGPAEQPHKASASDKITICVRKRPINSKEIKRKDYDSVTCTNPLVVVHDSKLKVDGISKYLDNTSFEVDHSFNENNTTEEIYYHSVQSLVEFVVKGGRATVFAYGQTGSGKTFTMQGIQTFLVQDLYQALDASEKGSRIQVTVSYFEIYGGRCQDLLNSRQRLQVREDGNGEVVVGDLEEFKVNDAASLADIIDIGNKNRTTHATESNDESSRSHAICQIILRAGDRLVGKMSLIDLAGSERGADTRSHNQQRRLEGAEINKSLLALKECIRALDSHSTHVPYRGSKLTLVLKDSFTNKSAKTVMISTVSPAASSADHTLNTLRYADRIKERSVGSQAKENKKKGIQPVNNHPPVPPRGGDVRKSRDDDNIMPPAATSNNVVEKNGSDDYDDMDLKKLEEDPTEMQFHQTVEHIFEEEEALLNLHMNIIQENAELLTEEGRLLQQIQGDDNDIDTYATRLDAILERKLLLITELRNKLNSFTESLAAEETLSKTLKPNKR